MDVKLALIILAASTWFMTGIIWFVQIVHYPLFAEVGSDKFLHYVQMHRSLTSLVVALPMVIQIVSALYVAIRSAREDTILLWINFGLVFLIWICTAAFSIPSHERLCTSGFSAVTHSWLVNTNWLRTIAWSITSLIMLAVLFRNLTAGSPD